MASPTKNVGAPKAPRSKADCVFAANRALISASCAFANSAGPSSCAVFNTAAISSPSSMLRPCSHIAANIVSMNAGAQSSACAATTSRMIFSVLTGKNGLNLNLCNRCLATKRCISSRSYASLLGISAYA